MSTPFYKQSWFLPIFMLIGIIIYLTMQSSTNSGSNFGTVQQQAPNFDSTAVRSYINNQVDGKFMSMIKQDTEFGKKFPPVKVLPQHLQLRILITGGAGFVGSHLTDRLMTAGHLVYVVDNFFTGRKRNVEHWVGHPNFQLILHDIVDPIHIEVDQIYHLACPASPPHYMYNPIKTIKTSTEGTLNMLGLAKRVHARMLLTSTSEVYGDPEVHPQKEDYWGHVNPIGPRACYDEGKRVAETMMYAYEKQQHLEVRVARIFNTFGPRMHPNDGRVVSNFIIQALQNRDITYMAMEARHALFSTWMILWRASSDL